jgi:hypothetical protein
MADARNSAALQIVDPVLSNVARQYSPDGFVYDQVAPSIPVAARSGQYPTFSGFFGDDSDSDSLQPIDDRAPTPEVSFDWSTDTYLALDFRLKASITNTERSQAAAIGDPLRLETSKLKYLLERMALRREVRIAAALRATGNGGQLTGGSASPSNKWGVDAATIEADVTTGALAVRAKIGFPTNVAVMDWKVAVTIAQQQDIRELVKYTVPGERILAGGYELPPVLFAHRPLISKAIRNTAKKGATESLSPIWDDHVRLLYIAENAAWGVPSTAYAFRAPIDGASGQSQVVDRFRTDDPPVEFIRAWEAVDEKVCGPDGGYELYDCLV